MFGEEFFAGLPGAAGEGLTEESDAEVRVFVFRPRGAGERVTAEERSEAADFVVGQPRRRLQLYAGGHVPEVPLEVSRLGEEWLVIGLLGKRAKRGQEECR